MIEQQLKTMKVEMTPSYEVDGGLWVEVDGVYHISPINKDGKLSEDTLCGLAKIGYNREWGYRLVAGTTICSICAEKGKYTNNKRSNMQNYKLVLKRRSPKSVTSYHDSGVTNKEIQE